MTLVYLAGRTITISDSQLFYLEYYVWAKPVSVTPLSLLWNSLYCVKRFFEM